MLDDAHGVPPYCVRPGRVWVPACLLCTYTAGRGIGGGKPVCGSEQPVERPPRRSTMLASIPENRIVARRVVVKEVRRVELCHVNI